MSEYLRRPSRGALRGRHLPLHPALADRPGRERASQGDASQDQGLELYLKGFVLSVLQVAVPHPDAEGPPHRELPEASRRPLVLVTASVCAPLDDTADFSSCRIRSAHHDGADARNGGVRSDVV